jgi:hypothetical protein
MVALRHFRFFTPHSDLLSQLPYIETLDVILHQKLLVFIFPFKCSIIKCWSVGIGQAFVSAVKLSIGGLRQIPVSSAINVNTSVLILSGSVASILLAAVFRGRV